MSTGSGAYGNTSFECQTQWHFYDLGSIQFEIDVEDDTCKVVSGTGFFGWLFS